VSTTPPRCRPCPRPSTTSGCRWCRRPRRPPCRWWCRPRRGWCWWCPSTTSPVVLVVPSTASPRVSVVPSTTSRVVSSQAPAGVRAGRAGGAAVGGAPGAAGPCPRRRPRCCVPSLEPSRGGSGRAAERNHGSSSVSAPAGSALGPGQLHAVAAFDGGDQQLDADPPQHAERVLGVGLHVARQPVVGVGERRGLPLGEVGDLLEQLGTVVALADPDEVLGTRQRADVHLGERVDQRPRRTARAGPGCRPRPPRGAPRRSAARAARRRPGRRPGTDAATRWPS
jgi:hypothetical protein